MLTFLLNKTDHFELNFPKKKKGHRNVNGVGGGVEFPLESEVARGVGVHQTGHLRIHLFTQLFLSFSIFYFLFFL